MPTVQPEPADVLRQLLSLSSERPGEARAEIRLGLRSAAYLADHAFQDIVVLPGSFYVEIARSVERQLTRRVPGLVRNVAFHSPVILGADDTVLRIEVRELGDGRVEYTFSERNAGQEGGDVPAAGRRAATLEVDRRPARPTIETGAFPLDAFQAEAGAPIDADRFYRQLRANGNQYGPGFQRIFSIWRVGDQALAHISAGRSDAERTWPGLPPSLLDAMTQALAALVMDRGRTFILRSIDQVAVTEGAEGELPDRLWAHAVRHAVGEQPFVGSVRVFDQSNRPFAELSGISLDFLERDDAPGEATGTTIVVASNFTADPVEESVSFWSEHFRAPVQVEFAPYDQIFQQLLDTGSAFHRNRDGVNVLLLGLEEWAAADGHENGEARTPGKERADRCFADRARYVLPNGLEIVHLNQYETDYLYKEIFEDQCYLRHGITLPEGATVVDIGANIGLFSLFVLSRSPTAKIYAFEPAPAVYDLLKANCDVYGSGARTFNLGVSDEPKTATFTFYEKSSVFSGFHADEARDRAAIQKVVRNTLSATTSVDSESMDAVVGELTAGRLRRTRQECRLTSVSEIIREQQLDRIDLLKIDAERSELDIIRGIAEPDWRKIDQIVMEIHDRTGEAVGRIEQLLAGKGYRCAVEEESLLEDSGLFNLYATRSTAPVGATGPKRQAGGRLDRTIGDLGAALRQFMKRAAAPLVLCCAPRTPAAQADADLKTALDDAEQRLLAEAGTIRNVHAIHSAAVLERYPVTDYYDPHGHHLGHIPYTAAGYAAIGTALFRAIFSLRRKPFKVIVLDCDNTLWRGVCGEEGPQGIQLSEPYRRLQEFMLARMHDGMLLCLCSKNNERDVLDVFDQRSDMVLKREHLVSWRINWCSKSDNVRSLARELNLGLDSFIFIDDNPVDCADVRANCPDALTLQMPPDAESFPVFLDHVWAFDHAGVTGEDRSRTRLYQENAEREKFREQVVSLGDFIRGLGLRVEIGEMTEDQLGRVSQLTFRTNQFNFTTLRRSEQAIREFLSRAQATCLTVRVADRFGDYGLVGAAIYERAADRYKVDTFLLSCRVLGRGVEHAVLADLGRRAVADGKRYVELAYRPTEKNAPAREFLTSIGERNVGEAADSWTFAADRLARLAYSPDAPPAAAPADTASRPRPGRAGERATEGLAAAARSEPLQHIAERLTDIGRIVEAISDHRLRHEPSPAAVDPAPRATFEAALLEIWRRVLGRPRIGLDDNFFEVGGTSLRAVQVIALIKKELRQSVSIVTLFECPTVARLAAKLGGGEASGADGGGAPGSSTAGAALRGQRRRNVLKRRAS